MDLEKFIDEVKTLEEERKVLATKIGQLEADVKKAVAERDVLAKKLVEVSEGYEV